MFSALAQIAANLLIEKKRKKSYKWSCRLNAFEHIPHTYFRSSLWVNLCLASADALPNTLLQTYEKREGKKIIEKSSSESFIVKIDNHFTKDGCLSKFWIFNDQISSFIHDKYSTEDYNLSSQTSERVTGILSKTQEPEKDFCVFEFLVLSSSAFLLLLIPTPTWQPPKWQRQPERQKE